MIRNTRPLPDNLFASLAAYGRNASFKYEHLFYDSARAHSVFSGERYHDRNTAENSTVMTQYRQKFREDLRFRVMRLLEDNPQSSQRDLARALGVSLGTVNYCLNALINVGYIKINNFRIATNKLGYAYLLTPAGMSEKLVLTQLFLHRKMQEHEALGAEIKAIRQEIIEQNDPENQYTKTMNVGTI